MPGFRFLSAALATAVVGGAVLVALSWHATLPAMPQPSADAFAPALIRRGATLAAIGNCAGCHSAPGRPAFSGGAPVETPFGSIYASNLTPDPDTGIGRWSEPAFRRAMRDGVDREGRNLYPAFPYNHYTLVTDQDDAALYAYLMTRAPARSEVPRPDLPFPLNVRAVMSAWNAVFFRSGAYAREPERGEDWNRGAYLVEGLGHCGACHTPHGPLGNEESDHHMAGGLAEGWNAYALNAASPAPIPWTVDALTFYLVHGWQAVHGVSRGPMALVTANLGSVPEADAHAMAVYLVSLMGSAEKPARAGPDEPASPMSAASAGSQVAVAATAAVSARSSDAGAALYEGACASCHASGRAVPYGGLPLDLSSALHAPDPSNIVTVTLHGLAAPPGAPGAIMPGFLGALDDRQIAALLAYLRSGIAHEAPWPDLDATVKAARSRAVTLYASDGTTGAPAVTHVRIAP